MNSEVLRRTNQFLDDFSRTTAARRVEFIAVTGSAARDEEVWRGDALVSDIDLMFVTARTNLMLTRQVSALIARHASEGIDGGPVPIGPLRRYATLSFFEARENGVTVWGSGDLRDVIPRYDGGLPMWEAVRVLANRLFEWVKVDAGASTTEHAITKTYEAIAEAALVLDRRYQPTFASRLDALRSQLPTAMNLEMGARLAAVLKRRFDAGAFDLPTPEVARRDLFAALERALCEYTGSSQGLDEQFALLRRTQRHPRHRAYAMGLEALGGRSPLPWAWTDPCIAVWREGMAHVRGDDDRVDAALLLRQWRRVPQVLSMRPSQGGTNGSPHG